MSFPKLAATGTAHTTTTNQTSKSVNCPAHNAGDRLVLMLCTDGNVDVTAVTDVDTDAWVNRFDNVVSGSTARLHVYEIVSRATAGSSSTVTVTLGANEMCGAQIIAIRGSHTTSALEASTAATGSSTAPNPSALNPGGWDVEDTFWLALCGWDGNVDASAFPTNYIGGTSVRAANTAGAGIAYAYRRNAVASEDPATFTITSEQWCAVTLAIRPLPITTEPLDYLLCYDIDEGSGSVLDNKGSKGSAWDLNISGASWVAGPGGGGVFDDALSFDGVDDRAETGTVASGDLLDGGEEFTLAVCGYFTTDAASYPEEQMAIGSDGGGSDNGLYLTGWSDGNVYGGFGTASGFEGEVTIDADGNGLRGTTYRWWIIVAESIGSNNVNVRSYYRTLAGSLIAGGAGNRSANLDNIDIDEFSLGNNAAGNEHLLGRIAAARVWNYAISEADMAFLGEGDTTQNAEATPATIAVATTIPAVSAEGGAVATPAAIEVSTTVPAPTISAGAVATPATIASVTAVPEVTVDASASAEVTPDTIAVITEIPAVTVSAGGDVTVTLATIEVTTDIPAVSASAGSTASPATIQAPASLPSVDVNLGVDIQPSTVEAVVTVPAVTIERGSIVEVDTIQVDVDIPQVDVVGLLNLWSEVDPAPGTTQWVRASG